MNITKIKRFLAKYGIGSPLNRLMYSHEEIEQMKERGEIFSGKHVGRKGRPLNSKNRSWEERVNSKKPGISLTDGKTVLTLRFPTKEKAIEFRDWNYGEKGKWDWEIIEIPLIN